MQKCCTLKVDAYYNSKELSHNGSNSFWLGRLCHLDSWLPIPKDMTIEKSVTQMLECTCDDEGVLPGLAQKGCIFPISAVLYLPVPGRSRASQMLDS